MRVNLTVALAAGTRFGACEITGELGVGGMGEVYRATDTNLKRDVAIKVLPESFAADADRLARFQREAEVLASLNHANIAQIYGLEKADEQTVIVRSRQRLSRVVFRQSGSDGRLWRA